MYAMGIEDMTAPVHERQLCVCFANARGKEKDDRSSASKKVKREYA
jgi:hypothetical protein